MQLELNLDIFSLLDVLSISTAFMLGLLFLTAKSKNYKANGFLTLFLWSLGTEVLVSFLDGQEIEYPSFIETGIITIPFLLLYVVKTLNKKISPWYLLVFTPFFLVVLDLPSVFGFLEYVFHIAILVYILFIINKHRKKVGDFYSDIENKTLSWIKTIVYIYLFFHLFWITEDIVGLKYEEITYYFAMISTVLTFVMIYWIGHNGFSQPEIFDASILALEEKETIDNAEETPTKISEQQEEDSSQLFQEITQKIQEDKLFLQTDISLRSLSKQLELNEKVFSKLIKNYTEKNFYHYINQFRVNEFKQLLQTEKANNLSLLGLSEEAGFSSKSTFYSAFKSSEGITPKQYQEQLRKG